jgi:hypothetical protein
MPSAGPAPAGNMPDTDAKPETRPAVVPPGQARRTGTALEPIVYATGKRAQDHAPGASHSKARTIASLIRRDPYLVILGAILGTTLLFGGWTAWALHDLHEDLQAPAVSRACTEARAKSMATAWAAKRTEGPGAHAQHEAIEEQLIQEAIAEEEACQ